MPRRNLNFASSAERRIIHGPKLILRGRPVVLVAARQQRRRQMELEAQIVAVELVLDLLEEGPSV